MSGKSCASGSVRSCGSVRLSAHHEIAAVALDALYDRKRDKKTVRVLTVIVYVFCVSLAAIMLSLYYVFFWEPKDTQRQVFHTVEHQTTTTPMPTCLLPLTGGGDITINGTSPPPLSTDNTTSASLTEAEPEDATAPSTHTSQDYTTDDIDVYNDTNNVT